MEGQSGVAYNVGSDEEVSIKELAYSVRDFLHSNADVKIQGIKIASARDKYVPDISLAKSSLNLSLNYDLKKAIVDTVNKLKNRSF